VFQVESPGEALTWTLIGNSVTVSRDSERCQGSITVVKELIPADNPGRFALEIDGKVEGGADAVGDQETTGTIAVTADQHTVGRIGCRGDEPRRLPRRDRLPLG
jgi:hypothetical protein